MKNRFLSIVCITISMIAFCSNKVYAQSKFHFDIDYHYNLGLSTSNTMEVDIGDVVIIKWVEIPFILQVAMM